MKMDNKEDILERVKKDGYSLRDAIYKLKDNEEIVMVSVQHNGWSLQYASDRLRDNKEIVMAAVKEYGTALKYTSDRLKDDKDIVMAALNNSGGHSILSLASERLRNDKDVILNAFKNDIHSVSKASVLLRSDPSFWLELTDLFQKIEHPYDNFNNTPVKEIPYDAMIGEAKTLFSTHHFNIDSVKNHLKNKQLLMKQNNDLINKLKNEIPHHKKDLFKRKLL
jgi:hypothetical protein